MPQVEASQLQISASQLAELRRLLQHYVPHAEVWAYGSRVTGTAHEGSDLDLVLRNPSDIVRDVEGWAELKEAVQASSLPMLVDIHLWSRMPSAFQAEIERAYVVLQPGGR